MNAKSFKLNASKLKIFISEPLCLKEKKGFFPMNEVIVFCCGAGIRKLNFLPLLPGRASEGWSVEFLPTKGNEVLISAYKKKISCLWSGYGWLAVVRRSSLKENQADSVSGSFFFRETNGPLKHQGRCMLDLAETLDHHNTAIHFQSQESAKSL